MQIHASCVARDRNGVPPQGVLLLGASGSGKSDLALRLIERGFVLVADDRVELDGVSAAPAPGLAGLLEVRGVGLVRMPWLAPVPVVLAVVLDGAAERLPEPDRDDVTGVPLLRLDGGAPSVVAKLVVALDCLAGTLGCVAGALEGEAGVRLAGCDDSP